MNRSRISRAPFLAGLAACLGLLTSAGAAAGASDPLTVNGPSKDGGRVVILGFDGADANLIKKLMEQDPARYPTFKKLADTGTFAPLEVVVPAESPVSWASINSGQNPAKTGVPGFIRRIIKNGTVSPGFGYIEKKEGKDAVPLESFSDTPLPIWTPTVTAAVAGGGVFLVVLLLALLLFRKLPVAGVLALLCGGGAAYAGHEARRMLPASYPRTANVNQVESFWDVAARAGVPCVVLDGAESFDAPTTSGARVLHGLGVPDARGGLGDWAIYTSDPALFSRQGKQTYTAGTLFRVDDEGGVIRAKIYGPKNFWEQQELQKEKETLEQELQSASNSLQRTSELSTRKDQVDDRLEWYKGGENFGKYGTDYGAGRVAVDLEIHPDNEGARVKIGAEEQHVALGQWSDFYSLTFELNWLLKVHALTRVRLNQLQPYFELLVDVLQIDPRQAPFWQPISSPSGFSADLASGCGLFETYGWPTLTMPFKDKKIQPEVLLEDVQFTEAWRETLTHEMLAKNDWRCLMSVFSTTDRVQHMTYQFFDEGHPLYKPEVAHREVEFFGEKTQLGQAIPAIYHHMDKIIGDVLAKLAPEDTLFVISDHGFGSFRRQVHVNNWLAENGYLALKPLVKGPSGNLGGLAFVDWSKTRAYACGLGFIYLNLAEREPNGIVARDDFRALVDEIRTRLLAATDPETGERFCSEVYVPRDIHSGKNLGLEADLIPGFKTPYRVSWSTSGGGLGTVEKDGVLAPGPVCTNNDSNWSGDHVSMSLADVPGVFFSNRKVKIPPEGVRSLQIAPTALKLLGVAATPEMDLPPLEVE